MTFIFELSLNQALESLKQTYATNDVSSEVVADISGQLLGNQEFINSLSLEQPSIFRRIYNKIIELANKITGNSNEALFIRDLKNKWEEAYRTTTTEQAVNNVNNTRYSLQTLRDGKKYVQTESNLFVDKDGNPLSQREIYNSLIGKVITLNDGIQVEIVNRLPNKNMYNEFFKRYPTYQNVNNIRDLNQTINENMVELLENSNNISPNESDYQGRHAKQGITNFDTRLVSFYDGNRAYDLTLSIAKLQNGKYVAYAKRNLSRNKNLTNQIRKEKPMSESQLTSLSDNNIPQSNENVKSGISTNNNMQNTQNNTNIINTKPNKMMNPLEISKLTPEDTNTSPILPTKKVSTGKGESHFVNNIENKTNMLNNDSKNLILSDNEVKFYQEVTNKGSLEKAFAKLNDGGRSEIIVG